MCWNTLKRDYFPNGIRVHVACIEGHEVDTDNTLIAYVAANALFQALGIANPKKCPNLIAEQGLIVFPKIGTPAAIGPVELTDDPILARGPRILVTFRAPGSAARCKLLRARMQISDETRKCVAFVGYRASSGLQLGGTAFFVGYPVTESGNALYIVTARHVIEEVKKRSSDGKGVFAPQPSRGRRAGTDPVRLLALA